MVLLFLIGAYTVHTRDCSLCQRSGQEDFQRGTPPLSLASCSIRPFFRACIITEWSSKDHETDRTGTSILISLLLLTFNMRLHGNPTAWYIFLATHFNRQWNFSVSMEASTNVHKHIYFHPLSMKFPLNWIYYHRPHGSFHGNNLFLLPWKLEQISREVDRKNEIMWRAQNDWSLGLRLISRLL